MRPAAEIAAEFCKSDTMLQVYEENITELIKQVKNDALEEAAQNVGETYDKWQVNTLKKLHGEGKILSLVLTEAQTNIRALKEE